MTKNYYPESVEYYGQILFRKISLKEKFKIERKAMRALPIDSPEQEYLSAESQGQYHVDCSSTHLFKNVEANLLNGSYNFVLLCDDEPILVCDPSLHHSYLANGKKVFATGSLTFDHGKLLEITNNSGHYTPTDEEMLAVIKALYKASGGTLKRYVSYCTITPKIYSVEDLLNATDFSSVRPLNQEQEIVSPSSIISEAKQSTPAKSSYLDDDCIDMETERSTPTLAPYKEKIVNQVNGSNHAQHPQSHYLDDEDIEISESVEPQTTTRSYPNSESVRRYGRDLNEKSIAKYLGIIGKNNFFKEGTHLKKERPVFNDNFELN